MSSRSSLSLGAAALVGVVSGAAVTWYMMVTYGRRHSWSSDQKDDTSTTAVVSSRHARPQSKQSTSPTTTTLPAELRTEQLSRHALYFGPQGLQQLHQAQICVVGVGGVGSHAATALVRGGAGHVRMVDFDTVSLSSLNRHACATLADVGLLKVHVLHRYLQQICPDPQHCTMDPMPTMYTTDQGAAQVLDNHNRPWTVVVDAIDDVPTKAALVADCVARKIPVVSCMGAGGKADFTRLHISDLKSAARDPLATKLRQALKQRFGKDNEALFEQVCTNSDLLTIIFSSESTVVGLAAMTDEQRQAKEQEGIQFGAVDGMRVRILPVLGTLPAIMGQGLATIVLTRLGGRPIDQPIPGQRLSHNVRHKLLQKYQQRERKWAMSHNQDPNVTKWSPKTDTEEKAQGYHTAEGLWFGPVLIDEMDVEYILEVWRNRCCLSQKRLGTVLELVRWNPCRPGTCDNIVVMSSQALRTFQGPESVQDVVLRQQVEARLATCRVDACAPSPPSRPRSLINSSTGGGNTDEENKNSGTMEETSKKTRAVSAPEPQSPVLEITEQAECTESLPPNTDIGSPKKEYYRSLLRPRPDPMSREVLLSNKSTINTISPQEATASTESVAPAVTPGEPASTKPRDIVKRRRRRKAAQENKPPVVDPVLLDKVLRESSLPSAYTFEVLKTVERIVELQASHVALQMPEGLLMYATVLADIFRRLAPCCTQVSVLGDVTYGACCVDDLGAEALGANLLVHYGHSCLVPLQHTTIPCLYVFVEIQLDVPHLVDCLDATVAENASSAGASGTKPFVYLLGTVQFRHALASARRMLQAKGYEYVVIPQAKPLSPGEVLGCTSPRLEQHQDTNAEQAIVCFLADGRFHLESTLISNAKNGIDTFYRYDPYSKTLTREAYNHSAMHELRKSAIQSASSAQTFGILMGTLGRQGNPAIVQRIRQSLNQHGKRHFLMLVSEITPAKLQLFSGKVDAWIQVACPRLSVDWGHHLADKPVLSPYELFVCLEETTWQNEYPMDFYSQSGGPWSNYYQENRDRQYSHAQVS